MIFTIIIFLFISIYIPDKTINIMSSKNSNNGMMGNISPEIGLSTVPAEQSVYATPVASAVTTYPSMARSFMIALLVISFMVLLYLLFDSPKEIVQSFIHKGCYKEGPCSQSSCPMKDPTNPFSMIKRNNKLASSYLEEMQQLHAEIVQDMEYLPEDLKKSKASFLSNRKTASLNILNKATTLIRHAAELNNKAISLDPSSPVKLAFILQHKSIALLNGLQLLKISQISEFKSYVIQIISDLLSPKINDVESQQGAERRGKFTAQIDSYGKIIGNLNTIIGDLTSTQPTPVFNQIDALINMLEKEIVTEADIGSIVTSISDTTETENKIIKELQKLNDVHQYMLTLLIEMEDSFTEGFDQREPGNIASSDANKSIEEGNYNDTIIKMSLEPSILENHKSFAEERNRIDTGAGMYGVRDDPNDVIPWVGLFRPTYKRSDGTSAEESKISLKAVPSDRPEKQMQERTKLVF